MSILRRVFDVNIMGMNGLNRDGEGSRFPQYFNSSTKTFHSPVLDTVIDAYLYCHQNDPVYKEIGIM